MITRIKLWFIVGSLGIAVEEGEMWCGCQTFTRQNTQIPLAVNTRPKWTPVNLLWGKDF
jgi:hypothetical protein